MALPEDESTMKWGTEGEYEEELDGRVEGTSRR